MSSQCPDTDSATATPAAEQWSNISKHVVNSYLEANNALLAAMGFSSAGTDASAAAETTMPSPTAEVSFGDETWVMERSTDDYDSLGVGDYVRFSKPIADTDVTAFAQVSGDTNRLHLESDFAEDTQFSGRIAHGTLVAGTISAALARLPGVTVYLSQTLEFTGPVRIGGRVTAECEIVEALGGDRYRLHTRVVDEADETVIDGEAVVIINELPET
ncbi:MaoC family dehydratase [Natrinema altunense]|uniref:MaoC domain-containing protein dehydratase n=1 Tax=Natrinema altunense (strain JCM 12890 / CGMCC 1.3731 / AJ2) TaxID=1227494 RepID=L9ZVR2_NATA2|nr:MaoC family dehydratase [Natrinema altunense]ELY89687.1 MaoC domain-containing protein dehydratase [Natrinema altunense JCM 12890]